MFHKDNPNLKRHQIGFYSLDELVPQDQFLRQVDKAIDFSFIYDLVEDSYSPDNGRPSLDPVLVVKLPLIQWFYGLRSMRQTIKEVDVNLAYRWFLGLNLDDKVPHILLTGGNLIATTLYLPEFRYVPELFERLQMYRAIALVLGITGAIIFARSFKTK